jgi:hypothetical protein
MDIEDNDFWKSIINSIPQDLSPKGLAPPALEAVESQSPVVVEGHLSKVSFDCFMFLAPDTGRYYLVQTNQKFQDIGDMTLEEAMKTIKYRNRKK